MCVWLILRSKMTTGTHEISYILFSFSIQWQVSLSCWGNRLSVLLSVWQCVSLLERCVISSYFSDSDEQWEYALKGNDTSIITQRNPPTRQYAHMTTHMQSSRMYRIEQYRHMRPQCDLSSIICSWRLYWIDVRDVALLKLAWQWKCISLLIWSAKVSKVHKALVVHAVMTTYPVKHYPCIVMQLLWAVYEMFTAIYDPLKGKSWLI